MDPLLLGSLLGFGFALSEEQVKQTQILESMRMYQTLQDIPEPQSVPERTGHQRDLVEKASKALENRDYELALSFSERVLKLEQSDPLYYILRGDCLARLGKISAAIEDYDRSLDMNERTRLLPPYLETSLKISLGQLEEIQVTISRSKQEPSLEDISRMLDEAKSRQAETRRTDEAEWRQVDTSRPVEAKSRQAETPRTDAFLVPDDLVAANRLAISQFVRNRELLLSEFMQGRPRDPLSVQRMLAGESGSDTMQRLVLYELSTQWLVAMHTLGYSGCVTLDVADCRLVTLWVQFVSYRSPKDQGLLYGTMGWLPRELHHVATERGFNLIGDGQDDVDEGGSLFDQYFSTQHAGLLAQTTEEILVLATADQEYAVTLEAENWGKKRNK